MFVLVEIIGEAANRVSDHKKKELADIPWKVIIGMRNRLIHGYDAVDLEVKTGKKLVYFLGPDGILLELAKYPT